MPPKTKLFVGKLPPTISERELQSHFEKYGQVTECAILSNYGFVHMKTEEEALAAIKGLNNYEINGFMISVEQSTTDKRTGGGGGGGRGMMRGRGRGRDGGHRDSYGGGGHREPYGGGPMRGGRMGGRPAPYDRRPPPAMDRYGSVGAPPPSRNGYYPDEYDSRDRRPPPFPMERRPMLPPRDPYRDYDKLDYDRLAPLPRRSPPPMMDRRAPPIGYGRRDDPYSDPYARDSLYARRPDPYAAAAPRDIMSMRRSPPRLSPPRRYSGPPRDMMLRQY